MNIQDKIKNAAIKSTDDNSVWEDFEKAAIDQIGEWLADFDFDALDEETGLDFIEWLVQDHYATDSQMANLIGRTHFWKVTDAYDVAADYFQYIVNETSAY